MNFIRLATIAALGLSVPLSGCSTTPVQRAFSAQPREAVRSPLEVTPREMAPADDYLIGPHDLLTLRVYELEKPGEIASLDLEVSSDGKIAVPFVGLVPAAGSTVTALRGAVTAALGARFLVDPQVMLGVKEYRSRMIAVMGNVAKPGVFYLNRNRVSLVDALSLAGGLSKEAGTRALVVRSKSAARNAGESDSTEIDLVAAIIGGDPANDIEIEAGMVIQVPPAEEFFVMGYVNKPGAFPYQRPVTVLQALAIAGGLDERRSSPSAVMIKRQTAQGIEVVQVDVSEIEAGKEPDLPIKPGDSIEAGRTAAWAVTSDILDSLKGIFGVGLTAGAL